LSRGEEMVSKDKKKELFFTPRHNCAGIPSGRIYVEDEEGKGRERGVRGQSEKVRENGKKK